MPHFWISRTATNPSKAEIIFNGGATPIFKLQYTAKNEPQHPARMPPTMAFGVNCGFPAVSKMLLLAPTPDSDSEDVLLKASELSMAGEL